MRRFNSRPLALAAAINTIVALQFVPAGSALAAEASSGPTEVQEITVSGKYTVGKVIDTATGLGLTLQETPQSVSIMTEQRIRDQSLDTIADVVLNAVGVSVNEVDNVRNTFNARGFEISNYQVDGVPLAWSLAGSRGETKADTAIYERVEIVRGATGLLTGAGDPSASINLVRKHADSTSFEGFVNAGTGSWDNRKVMADLAGGLNREGTLRGRVVAKYEAGESFTDWYEKDRNIFYGVLESDLTQNTLLRVGASYQHSDPTAPTWGALPTFYTDGSLADWPRSKSSAAHWTRWKTENLNYFANLVHNFDNGWRLAVNYNRLENSESTKLLYLFGLVDKETGEGLLSNPYRSDGDSTQDSFDVQLKGDFSVLGQSHDFVLGALHSEQDEIADTFAAPVWADPGDFIRWDGTFAEPDWDTTPSRDQELITEQSGVYGAARFSLSDRLKVIAGGRVSKWERQGVSYGTVVDFGESGEFVPYAGVLYDLADQHRLYVSYTEIFMPQEARDRNGDFIDPLLGENREIGLKSAFFDSALNTSIAYFVIEQDNLAQPDPGHVIPGTIFPASRAAQGTESKGFEVEIVGEPLTGWNLILGYTQFEAEDGGGNKVNTDHPRKQLKLFTTYDFSSFLPGLMVGGGVNWQSEIYSDSANPVTEEAGQLQQDAYTLLSLMARYDVTPQLSLQLNMENLSDETFYSQVGFFDQYRYGEPRNYSLSVNWQF